MNARSSQPPAPRSSALAAAVLALVGTILTGCASPGSPRPPTLRLPNKARALKAQRVGDQVLLSWTTPNDTTDGDPIRGQVSFVICRETPGTPCDPVQRGPARPGAAETAVPLPPPLLTGAPVPLRYKVELLNDRGRSAGPSDPVYAASGPAPAPAGTLTATATRTGTLLTWQPAADHAGMQIRRTGAGAEETLLQPDGSAPDPGGMIDRSVRAAKAEGLPATYVAQRTRTVDLGGRRLLLYGVPSAPVTFTYHDTFAPEPPAGLLAIPSLTPPSIDLSWEASREDDLLGYNIYRAEPGSKPVLLNNKPASAPAYRDATARPGVEYVYTVTAVGRNHLESAAGAPVRESLSR